MAAQPEPIRPTGSFTCPNDGTNDLDFVCAYDSDGPCGYICPVCYASKLGVVTAYDVQREAYAIFKNWVMAAMQRSTLDLNRTRHNLLARQHED